MLTCATPGPVSYAVAVKNLLRRRGSHHPAALLSAVSPYPRAGSCSSGRRMARHRLCWAAWLNRGGGMSKTIKLTLTEDEAEMLVDALEADMEGYTEAIKEARGNNNRDDVETFTEAAQRILELSKKIQALLGE